MKEKENHIEHQEHDTNLRNFDDFCIASVLERFAFWKKSNEKKIDNNPGELLAEFRDKKLPELTGLLHILIERLEGTGFKDLGLNPFRLIDKGINHAYAKQHQKAVDLFKSSIGLNPDFCAFAQFNLALSLIELGGFDEANGALDAARKQIEEAELPRICAIATMLSNLPTNSNCHKNGESQGNDALAKQLELHTTILSAVLTNIGEAKQTMAELRNDGHTPGAYFCLSHRVNQVSLAKRHAKS